MFLLIIHVRLLPNSGSSDSLHRQESICFVSTKQDALVSDYLPWYLCLTDSTYSRN
jgi:hypothetical protein